jgi:hypothetical protein
MVYRQTGKVLRFRKFLFRAKESIAQKRNFRTDRILKMKVLDTPLPRSPRYRYSEWWRHGEISSQVNAV